MRYMLMVCHDESFSPTETIGAETEAWVEEMERRGVRKDGGILRPAEDATSVRVRGEEVLLSDGPFAETKEWIAGYDIVECEDLDEAIEVASRHPMAKAGTIEIRPFPEA
jgi:hypothetical protein